MTDDIVSQLYQPLLEIMEQFDVNVQQQWNIAAFLSQKKKKMQQLHETHLSAFRSCDPVTSDQCEMIVLNWLYERHTFRF